MPKTKLLRRQKSTVEAWCSEHNGRVIQIIDRSCRYREAVIEWYKEVLYPQLKQKAIIYYQTSLEVTPTGKIRREIHQQKEVRYIPVEEFAFDTQLILPLGEIVEQLPPPPKDVIRAYLFPRDKGERATGKKDRLKRSDAKKWHRPKAVKTRG